MTDRELMQMALDALEKLNKDGWILADFEDEVYASIEALRARLAQPEPEPTRSQKLRDAGYTRRPKGWDKDGEEQEPVAWADKYDLDREGHDFWVSRQANVRTGVPLYTAPPQRDDAPAKAVEWQGLTDKEILADDVLRYHFGLSGGAGPVSKKGKAIVAAVEAKLKEKNS